MGGRSTGQAQEQLEKYVTSSLIGRLQHSVPFSTEFFCNCPFNISPFSELFLQDLLSTHIYFMILLQNSSIFVEQSHKCMLFVLSKTFFGKREKTSN